MKRVLIVTCYRYPNGDAGAVRQHSFAKIYKELGYEVVVAGLGLHTAFSMRQYDDVSYVSFRNKKSNIVAKIKNYLLYKYNLKHFLSKEKKFDVMHVVNVPTKVFSFLKRYAKKRGIKLVHDSVEWYSPEQFKNGKKNSSYKAKDKLNKKLIDEQFSVIAISTFLEKHFKAKDINTVRVPVIMDVESISCEKLTDPGKTVFLYAGSPGKKDYLSEILAGFSLLSESELGKLEIRLIGITCGQLVSVCGVKEETIERISSSLKCFGRVSREEVLDNLKEADFTILLRSETLRYAKAGFPTKVVESLAAATPVITNLTSDLGMYLEDGKDSLIVNSCSSSDLAQTLKKAASLSATERDDMYNFSRKKAESAFDYKLYIQRFDELLKN